MNARQHKKHELQLEPWPEARRWRAQIQSCERVGMRDLTAIRVWCPPRSMAASRWRAAGYQVDRVAHLSRGTIVYFKPPKPAPDSMPVTLPSIPFWCWWAALNSRTCDAAEQTINHAESSFGTTEAGIRGPCILAYLQIHLQAAVRQSDGGLYAEVRVVGPANLGELLSKPPEQVRVEVETTGRCYVHRPGTTKGEPPVDIMCVALCLDLDLPPLDMPSLTPLPLDRQ